MTAAVRETFARGVERLRQAGIESARIDARVLLAHVIGASADAIFAREDLSAEQFERFNVLLARRAAREPLAYIIGEKEFWSLPFSVGSGVLIPRPETETLIEAALRDFPDSAALLRVLDIGTGSGCLLIAFLKKRPNATGLGVDISEAALAFATRNLCRYRLADRCRLELEITEGTESDCAEDAHPFSCGLAAPFSPVPHGSATGFDVILANPPYLTDAEFEASPPEIRDYEPREALAAGPDGLAAIQSLATTVSQTLGANGRAYVEIGQGQAAAAAAILEAAGLEVLRTEPDLSAVTRCLVMGRAETGGRPRLPKISVGKNRATG